MLVVFLRAVKNAQKRLVAATMQASKDLKKSKARKSGKGWLVVGIIASAIIAGSRCRPGSPGSRSPISTHR